MYAIVTLVMNGDAYVPGAVALAHSLRIFSSGDTICMVTPDVSENGKATLSAAFDKVVVVEKITAVSPPPLLSMTAQKIYRWVADAPTKWNMLQFDEYDRVLFMDADMIAIAPMDDVFRIKVPAGVFDHQMAQKYVRRSEYTGDTGSSSSVSGVSSASNARGSGIVNRYGDVLPGAIVPRDVIGHLRDRNDQFALQGGLVLL